jgi:hypothetical protein
VADRYAELRSAIEGHSLPLALLDLDALDHNAHVLLARAQGLPIRLCSKSVRSVFVLRHLQQLSPHFRGILCYSAREAAYLHRQGFRDLLVAYPASIRATCAPPSTPAPRAPTCASWWTTPRSSALDRGGAPGAGAAARLHRPRPLQRLRRAVLRRAPLAAAHARRRHRAGRAHRRRARTHCSSRA